MRVLPLVAFVFAYLLPASMHAQVPGSQGPYAAGGDTAVNQGTGNYWCGSTLRCPLTASDLAGNELVAIDNNMASNGIGNTDAVSSRTDQLIAKNFGFSIPSNATITGIQVDAYVGGQYYVLDYGILLVDASGNPVGADHTGGGYWSGGMHWKTWGNSTDNWSAGLTASDVNSPNFGVAMRARTTLPYVPQCSCSTGTPCGADFAYIDEVQVTVWYTVP